MFLDLNVCVTGTKTTKFIDFLNQDKNMIKPHSKFKFQNKNKNTTCAKQKFNKILLQEQ